MYELKLKEVVLELAMKKVDAEEITADTSLTNDLGYDSILFVELIVNLEMEFNIAIDDEGLDINLFLNFGNLLDYVKQKVEQLDTADQPV